MVMRRVVSSYFAIVRNTMKDLVPKVVMRFVVNHAVETVHGHLVSKILRHALFTITVHAIQCAVGSIDGWDSVP